MLQVANHGGRDRCGGCQHPRRADLDAALAGGTSLRKVAAQFGISTTAVHRHKHAHLPQTLVRVVPASVTPGKVGTSVHTFAAPATSEDVLTSLQRLYRVCSDALEVAAESGNLLQLALASRELRAALEVIGRQIERLEARRGAPVIEWANTADFMDAIQGLRRVLAEFPEADEAVRVWLRKVNHDRD